MSFIGKEEAKSSIPSWEKFKVPFENLLVLRLNKDIYQLFCSKSLICLKKRNKQ